MKNRSRGRGEFWKKYKKIHRPQVFENKNKKKKTKKPEKKKIK